MAGLLDDQLAAAQAAAPSGLLDPGLVQLAGDVVPFPAAPKIYQDNDPRDALDPDSRLRRSFFMRGPAWDMINRQTFMGGGHHNDNRWPSRSS